MQDLAPNATAFLILFARIGAVLMLLPVFSEDAIPARIRLLMGLGMTAALWGILQDRLPRTALADSALPGILIAELLTGLAMGTIVRLLFFAMAMAGSLISLQVGLSSALVVDASQGGQAPMLSKFVAVAAAVVCMGMGVHHLWLASIVHSYALFPVGGMPSAPDFARLAIATVARSTALAISLAAPLIVYNILFSVALGLSDRVAPAIQIFFIAQPLNILLGLAVLATMLGTMLTRFASAMADWLNSGWA